MPNLVRRDRKADGAEIEWHNENVRALRASMTMPPAKIQSIKD
jgi:hypothetical protein